MSNNPLFRNISNEPGTWVFYTPNHPLGIMLRYLHKNTILVHLGKYYSATSEDLSSVISHGDVDVHFDWDYKGSFRFDDGEFDLKNFDLKKAYELADQRKLLTTDVSLLIDRIQQLEDEGICVDCGIVAVNQEDGLNTCPACLMDNFP